MEKTYYEILGINVNASDDEIKIAYSYNVKKYPPEKNKIEFNEIRSSYEVLMNKNKRSIYDYGLAIVYKEAKKYKEAEMYLINSINLNKKTDYRVYLELLQVSYINNNNKLIESSKVNLSNIINDKNFTTINNYIVDIIIEGINSNKILQSIDATEFGGQLAYELKNDDLVEKYSKMEEQLKQLFYLKKDKEIIKEVKNRIYSDIVMKILNEDNSEDIELREEFINKLKCISRKNYGLVKNSFDKAKSKYELLYYGSKFYEVDFELTKDITEYIEECNCNYNNIKSGEDK